MKINLFPFFVLFVFVVSINNIRFTNQHSKNRMAKFLTNLKSSFNSEYSNKAKYKVEPSAKDKFLEWPEGKRVK